VAQLFAVDLADLARVSRPRVLLDQQHETTIGTEQLLAYFRSVDAVGITQEVSNETR